MADLAMIAAALSSVKTATDIAKYFRESDLSMDKAEIKLKLADLVSALADVKMELAEVQETLAAKDARVLELQNALELKETVVRHRDAYYMADDNGDPIGSPMCLRCWEVDHKLRNLVRFAKNHRIRECPACGKMYEGFSAAEIAPKNDNEGA